jgi:hypothetical protein
MLATNIRQRVVEIIKAKGKGGWIRVQECAKEYAEAAKINPKIKENPESRMTKFYRFRKQVEKGKVEGLKVLLLAGNISFIGVSSADPQVIEKIISENKKAERNVKTGLGFYDWWEHRAERKREALAKELDALTCEDEAETEIMQLSEDDPEFLHKASDIRRKHGL